MVTLLLLVVVLILLFGARAVKAWIGAALAIGLLAAVFLVDGLAVSMFSNVWLLLLLGGCGVAIYFQGWQRSLEQFSGSTDDEETRE